MKSRLFFIRWIFVTFSLFIFTILLPTSWAQNENSEKLRDDADAKEFTDKVQKNLSDKYSKDSIREVKSFVKKGLNGSKIKSFHIRGDIKPETSVLSLEKEHTKSRELAQAFIIEQSSELFEVTDINDLREYKVSVSKDATGEHDFTNLYFSRYVENLKIDGSYIHITVKDDDSISSISANIVPISKEMLKAVKIKTLTEEEIKKIVEDDLQSDASAPDTPRYIVDRIFKVSEYPRYKKIEKLAIPESPYIVFSVESIWNYTIDAFTGKILKKISSIIID